MNKSRLVQYYATFAVSLANISNSMAFFWAAPILPQFNNDEIIKGITRTEISWVLTIIIPGNVMGSMLASRISDRFGRRNTILISVVPFILGTVIVLCATKAWMLYIARLIWGLATGLISSVPSIYLSEISDSEIRGTLSASLRFMFNFGAFITVTVGSYLSYQILSSLLIIIPVCCFVACWWIPESPYYLIKEGKIEAAKKVLFRLSGSKDEKMIEEKLGLMRSQVRKEMTRSGSAKELLLGKQYRKALIITTGLRFTQIMTGMIVMQQYLSTIVEQSNCGLKISTAFVIYGFTRLVVSLIAPFVVDKVGRRPLLIVAFSVVSFLLTIAGFYFFIQQTIGIKNESTSPFRYTVFVALLLSKIFANFGFDTLVFVIPSEIFPLNVKSTAMACFTLFSACFSFTSIKGFQPLVDWIGMQGVFWMYASVALSGAIFTYFVIPETKGKTLREIQIELQGDLYDEAEIKLNTVGVVTEKVESDSELNTDPLVKAVESKDATSKDSTSIIKETLPTN